MAFYLRYVEDLPARDVAGRLGLSPGAVHQARYKVGLMLLKEGERLQAEGFA
jgi:DNA-directed RNA polymerase specialized sigma24 family protein